MSGYKRALVRISQEEYQRLHEADMKARFVEHKRERKNSSQRSDEAYKNLLAAMEERQQQFNQAIQSMDNEISDLEIAAQEEFVKQQAGFYQELSARMADVWENEASLEETLKHVHQHFADENNLRKLHSEKTDLIIHNLFSDLSQKNELAEMWLTSADEMRRFIENQYDHNHFVPGELKKINRDLGHAQWNISHGMPEAALSSAQQAYLHLSDLHLKLEQVVNEWQALYLLAFHATQELYEMVKANACCSALDLEGNKLPISLQLNYWSQGRYNVILQRLKEILLDLKGRISTISSSELNSLSQNELPGLEKEFESIISQARFSAINSQLRVNVADCALQALEGQGFVEENSGYLDNDKRNSYLMRLVNFDGDMVTIQVSPKSDEETANDIAVISQDAFQRTEHELRQRSQEITKTLLQYGLRVGPIQTAVQRNDEQNLNVTPIQTPSRQHHRSQGVTYDRTNP